METSTLIELLATENKYQGIQQVASWQNNKLINSYQAVFMKFQDVVVETLEPFGFAEVVAATGYEFDVRLFEGQTVIRATLNFARVDGFNLLGSIALVTNPDKQDSKQTVVAMTKDGVILDPRTGRSPEQTIGTVQDQAQYIIGAVIREAIPYEQF